MSMNEKEFAKMAVRCGYCEAQTVSAYIKRNKKAEYTEEDLQAVFRLEEAVSASWTTKKELRDANF